MAQPWEVCVQGQSAAESAESNANEREPSGNERPGVTRGAPPFSSPSSASNLRSMSDTRKAKFRKILDEQVGPFWGLGIIEEGLVVPWMFLVLIWRVCKRRGEVREALPRFPKKVCCTSKVGAWQ